MPLIPRQGGYVQVHVLPRLEVEVLGSPDEQLDHLVRQGLVSITLKQVIKSREPIKK